MLDTDSVRKYADKANAIVSLQAIKHCPDRRLELESMAPHLASMLAETAYELSRVYDVLRERNQASKTYSNLDREVLKLVSGFTQSKIGDLSRIIGTSVKARKIEESLTHLKKQGDIIYRHRGDLKGWSAI